MGLTIGAMGYITQLDIDISKGSLARKLPKLRVIVMVSIPTIMSTTLSCQPHHHQVVGKRNSSNANGFRGGRT